MKRRDFLTAGMTAGAAAAGLGAARASAQEPADEAAAGRGGFKLKYAPHFGMFEESAGEDLVAQLEFAADEGFTAWEDNGMKGRPKAEQERLAKAMERLGITMGVFVASADFKKVTFASTDPDVRRMIRREIEESIEVAKRVNAQWCTVVPGRIDLGLEWDYQTANVIDNLKRCAEMCEPHGLVMVLEPLNWYANHPGLFLTKIPQGYQICRAVGSPSCKILDDLYHQQVTEGNLIPNLDRAWEEIAYIQLGDNPGRKEPTTGEINYKNIFKHLHAKGYQGIVGMEHGNSKPGRKGERAVIEAYQEVDNFEV
ncbi:MAG: hydroxypyruvate isomerase family protein [Candidatus Hydrogenedentota bacterium]